MTAETLKRELEKIVSISAKFGAVKVILFGSCLENFKTARDIDIAVSGIKPREFFKFYGRVSAEVQDQVDILDLDEISPHFLNRILSQGKVIYEQRI